MKHLLLLILVAASLPALAQTSVEAAFLRKLRQARSAQQLQQVQAEHDGLDQSKRICTFQLRQNVMPSACYRRLFLEQRWKLIADVQAKEWASKLDERCEAAAKAALHENIESLLVRDQNLSQECRRMIEQAREIAKYRSDEIFSRASGAEIENPASP